MARKGKIRWLTWSITFVVLWGVYLLYVSSVEMTEVYVGIVAAGVATFTAGLLGFFGTVQFRPSLSDLLQGWRVPWDLIDGTYQVFKAAWKQLASRQPPRSGLEAVPFRVGDDHPRAAARRALAEFYTTLTPGVVVLGIARKQSKLLYHRILPGQVPTVATRLGAEPNV